MATPSLLFYTHPACLEHRPPPSAPERPGRLSAILEAVHAAPWAAELEWREGPAVTAEDCLRVHTAEYLAQIEATCAAATSPLLLPDDDTWVGPGTWAAAQHAAGATVAATAAVWRGEARRAFVAVRPPGHHARPGEAMGFCLLANVAIAIRHAQAHYGLRRVLVVDWDVHHGNGTEEIFYADPSVFMCSLHQMPLWPGTGLASDTGTGAGKGYTLNLPMPPGATGADYQRAFLEELEPRARAFAPELVVISAGFDAHRGDPLAQVCLEAEDFASMTRRLVALAETSAQGRVVSVLEGGYHLGNLAASVVAHLGALRDGAA